MIENLMANKKTVALILVLLVLAFFFLIFTIFFKPPSSTTTASPSPSTEAIPYNPDALNQNYVRLSKPKPLSAQDESAKEKLLASIGNKSGILQRTPTYYIEYVATANLFMIFLESANADQTKQDAEKWLSNQGLTQQGICNLPVEFVLGGVPADQYRQQNKQFNPTPDGC